MNSELNDGNLEKLENDLGNAIMAILGVYKVENTDEGLDAFRYLVNRSCDKILPGRFGGASPYPEVSVSFEEGGISVNVKFKTPNKLPI